MVDIIGLLESESLSEFPTWEENRSKLITRIGHFLIASSESQIAKSFEDCLAWITANIKIERPKSQMMALMAFSIMSHFLGDVSQFKSLLPNLLTILANKNMDVVKAAVTVLKWLALELPESVDLVLRSPVETAFKWITEKSSKHFFNALYIIKVGKEFYEGMVVRNITQNQEQFFEIVRISEVFPHPAQPATRIFGRLPNAWSASKFCSNSTLKSLFSIISLQQFPILASHSSSTALPFSFCSRAMIRASSSLCPIRRSRCSRKPAEGGTSSILPG